MSAVFFILHPMLEYLVVGFGLAGLNVVCELQNRKKTFLVIDHDFQKASTVAGGEINPLILKRFTKAWQADQFLPAAIDRYQGIEKQLEVDLLRRIPMYRKINSVKEQNDWFVAADKPELSPYMATPLKQIDTLRSPFQYGEVKNTWLLDTPKLLKRYKEHLHHTDHFCHATFFHENLKIHSEFVQYENIKAKKIIFCEGMQALKNPYFNKLPLIGNKGEYLIVSIPGLGLNKIIKTTLDLIPLGNDYYKFGATYSRNYPDIKPEIKNRNLLVKKLEALIDQPYVLADQVSGIRPTVIDRRPLVGQHPQYPNILILNGLGTHGIMTAPLLSQWLLDFDLNKKELPKTVNVQRYPK